MQINQRDTSPHGVAPRATRVRRHPAHSLLEAELQDIRQSLSRLERELDDKVIEMPGRLDDSRAA